MTVSELIDALSKFPGYLPVLVAGFDEYGYDDAAPPVEVEYEQVREASGHLPKYEDAPQNGAKLKAVLINF